MVARRHCDVKAAVALSVDSHQLWHPSSGVEIKFEYVSGHLPANFSTEEIEIKDRVALMLLKSVFVSTGRDRDKPGGEDKYLDPFWLLPPMIIA